jgi:hypothetical protein
MKQGGFLTFILLIKRIKSSKLIKEYDLMHLNLHSLELLLGHGHLIDTVLVLWDVELILDGVSPAVVLLIEWLLESREVIAPAESGAVGAVAEDGS